MLNYVFVAASTWTLNGSSEFADIRMYSCYINYALYCIDISISLCSTY